MKVLLTMIDLKKVIIALLIYSLTVFSVSFLPSQFNVDLILILLDLVLFLWLIFLFRKKVNISDLFYDFRAQLNWLELFLLLTALISFSVGMSILSIWVTQAGHPVQPDYINTYIFDIKTIWDKLYIIISVILITPVIEEIMFRGILFSLLMRIWSIPAAILVSSFLFGLMHGRYSALQGIFFGILMCLLYLKTNNILFPIFVHFLNNLAYGAYNLLVSFSLIEPIQPDLSSQVTVWFGGVFPAALGLVIFIWYLRSNWPRKEKAL